MEAHSFVAVAVVLYTMEANVITNVATFIFTNNIFCAFLHSSIGCGFFYIFWPFKDFLLHLSIQHLEEAVCVGVVVDAAALSLVPAQHHQVELAVTYIHQVTCVSVRVKLGELLPLGGLAGVGGHESLHVLHADVVVGEHLVQALDEFLQGGGGRDGRGVAELVWHGGTVNV